MKDGHYREISGIDFQWPRSMPTKWSGGFYGPYAKYYKECNNYCTGGKTLCIGLGEITENKSSSI